MLVAVGRLQPILVTLATLSIFQGIAIRVLPEPGGQVPDIYTDLVANTTGPWSLVYVLLLVLFWSGFRRTCLGSGSMPSATTNRRRRRTASRRRTKIIAYVLSGVFAAIAGLFMAATATAGDATTGNGYTLRSIVAVVLGGVSLFGGRGTPVGAILGAFVSTHDRQHPVLRADRPALPELLRGPVPGHRGADHRRRRASDARRA